eukprot:scaffold108668_cov26-Tisochrysis_lutea.AAC.1
MPCAAACDCAAAQGHVIRHKWPGEEMYELHGPQSDGERADDPAEPGARCLRDEPAFPEHGGHLLVCRRLREHKARKVSAREKANDEANQLDRQLIQPAHLGAAGGALANAHRAATAGGGSGTAECG